jgi:hypothetical protein
VTIETTEEKCQQCGEPIKFEISQGQVSAGMVPVEVSWEGRCPKCGYVEYRHLVTGAGMST